MSSRRFARASGGGTAEEGELNRRFVESLALLTDAWVTRKSWVTAYAMRTYADQFFSLTPELETEPTDLMRTSERDVPRLLTEHDDRYQEAVSAWTSLAGRCGVDSELPAAPLAPSA